MSKLYKTATTGYWQSFSVGEEDMDRLYELVLSVGKPVALRGLVRHVIAGRCEAEAKKIAADRKKGAPYQPSDSYSVGQKLSFAALGHRHGEVTSVRQGHNPRYGPFEVIQVQMENPSETREFAAAFPEEHVLNLPLAPEEEAPDVEELVLEYGPYVQERLLESLQQNPEFVSYDELWLLKDLLLDVHEGYRNIAEAMIDVTGAALPVEELLKEIDLPESADRSLKHFSLNYALSQDERFINVGTNEEPLWYLTRLAHEGEGV